MTVGSRSTNTALGTCLPAPVSEKKVLKLSSPPPIVLSLGICPSGWIPDQKGNMIQGKNFEGRFNASGGKILWLKLRVKCYAMRSIQISYRRTSKTQRCLMFTILAVPYFTYFVARNKNIARQSNSSVPLPLT
jgi:hypothetical protein